MGVLPLQFSPGENRESLGLTGLETYSFDGIAEAISHGKRVCVRSLAPDGVEKKFDVLLRIDTPQEVEYYRNGGILPYVLRQIAVAAAVS